MHFLLRRRKAKLRYSWAQPPFANGLQSSFREVRQAHPL